MHWLNTGIQRISGSRKAGSASIDTANVHGRKDGK